MITVYLNLTQLESWLALKPLKSLIDAIDVEIEWQAVLTSLGNVTAKPLADDPLAEYKNRRAKARRAATDREFERQCEHLSLDPSVVNQNFEGEPVSLGLSYLNQAGVPSTQVFDYLDQIFARIFNGEKSAPGLGEVAEILGIDEAQLQRQDICAGDELLDRGILSAPAIVVEGEIFHGREHFPLITWMLTGRNGSPPV